MVSVFSLRRALVDAGYRSVGQGVGALVKGRAW